MTEKEFIRCVIQELVDVYGLSKKKAKACIKSSVFEWQIQHNPMEMLSHSPALVAKDLYTYYVDASFDD